MMFENWTNSDFIQLIQTSILLITLFFMAYQLIKQHKQHIEQLEISNKQNWLLIYSEYTRRYSKILSILPQDFFDKQWKGKINIHMKLTMRRYFDLCYEQWSLYHNKPVEKSKITICNPRCLFYHR